MVSDSKESVPFRLFKIFYLNLSFPDYPSKPVYGPYVKIGADWTGNVISSLFARESLAGADPVRSIE